MLQFAVLRNASFRLSCGVNVHHQVECFHKEEAGSYRRNSWVSIPEQVRVILDNISSHSFCEDIKKTNEPCQQSRGPKWGFCQGGRATHMRDMLPHALSLSFAFSCVANMMDLCLWSLSLSLSLSLTFIPNHSSLSSTMVSYLAVYFIE